VPFDFLGVMTQDDLSALEEWLKQKTQYLSEMTSFHQMRSAQLRKTAGILEDFYTEKEDPLSPSFVKGVFTPHPKGQKTLSIQDDTTPAICTGLIKERMQTLLEYEDDIVFRMNHVRAMIEAHEDEALDLQDAPAVIKANIQTLKSLFGRPEFVRTLVSKGDMDKYRTDPYTPPTETELLMMQNPAVD